MKTGIIVLKRPFLYALFLFFPLGLFAQAAPRQTVAVIPFTGEDVDVAEQFGEEAVYGINELDGYRSVPIDMSPASLPDDVPEGGFPAFVPPMPSLTRGTPYAMTGSVDWSDDYSAYVVQLFLWEMGSEIRLIWSDWMTAYDLEECQARLPGTLEWMFSKIGTEAGPSVVVSDASRVVYYAPTDPDKWIYLGLRAGGYLRVHAPPLSDVKDLDYTLLYGGSHFENVNAAFQFNFQPFNALGLQLEAVFNMELKPFEETVMSLMFPFMLRFTQRNGTFAFSMFGGSYLDLPLGYAKDNFAMYPEVPLGVTGGFQFGNKAGSGHIFLDIRWAMDLFDTYNTVPIGGIDPYEGFFRRHIFSIGIGYEFGFVTKK